MHPAGMGCLQHRLWSALLVVLATTTFEPVSAAVKISSPSLPRVTVNSGQTFTLVCEHPSVDVQLGWYFNGEPVTSGPTMTVTPVVEESGGVGRRLLLTVTRASVAARGRYQCSNQDNHFDYDYIRVEVRSLLQPGSARPDEQVQIVQPETDAISVGEGGALTLKCHSTSGTAVTWYHDGQQVASDARTIMKSSVNFTLDVTISVLAVMEMTPDDRGVYACRDINDSDNIDRVNVTVNKANMSQEVTITDPPGIRAIFPVGRVLTARCRGNGSRLLEWRKGGLPVVASSRVIITTTRLSGEEVIETQLRISDLELQDGGEYTCRDRARFLQKASFRALIVKPLNPVTITSPLKNETTVQLDGSFAITCMASINSYVRWKLNGVTVVPGPKVNIVVSRNRTARTLTSLLTVIDVTSLDTGRYTCQDVRDDINYDEIEMMIAATTAPITLSIAQPSTSYTSVLAGNFLVIECVGQEGTSIRWRHNGFVLNFRERPGYVLSSLVDVRRRTSSSLLIIYSVTKAEAGVFTCEDTSNYLNSDSVGVRVPSGVNITTGDVALPQGRLLQLPCVADAGTDLQWFKDGELIDATQEGVSVYLAEDALSGKVTSILSFANTEDHSGEYICRDIHFTENSMKVKVFYRQNDESDEPERPAIDILNPADILSTEGSRLALRCRAQAGARPYWTRNGVALISGNGISILTTVVTSGESWTSVVFDSLRRTHSGVYECRNRNNEHQRDRTMLAVGPAQ